MMYKRFKVAKMNQCLYKVHSSFLLLFVLCCTSFLSHANQTAKPAWYRYYDSNGISNVSTSVSPAHIRYGYETLDNNMQVIKRNPAYDTETDIRQAAKRAAQAQQLAEDTRLKNAYNSAKVAELKRNEALLNLKKQINLQQKQLKQLKHDHSLLKQQENSYIRKGEPLPADLKQRLQYNAQNIATLQKHIVNLQTYYVETEEKYNKIIARLKVIS